jgi:hypothetical protein
VSAATAEDRLAAEESAERASHARLEEAGFVLPERRDDPEEERQDRVPVGDHVQRQDQDDQQVPDGPEAGHRQLLERSRELGGVRGQVVEEALELRDEVDLLQPQRPEPFLPRGDDVRQLLAERGDAGDERGDRLGQRTGDEDDDEDDRADEDGVDQDDGPDPGKHGNEPDEAGHDRAEDERQEPGQEEDEDDVAEGEEDLGREVHRDHRQNERAEDEDGRQQALLPIRQAEHPRVSPRAAKPPRGMKGRRPSPLRPW